MDDNGLDSALYTNKQPARSKEPFSKQSTDMDNHASENRSKTKFRNVVCAYEKTLKRTVSSIMLFCFTDRSEGTQYCPIKHGPFP